MAGVKRTKRWRGGRRPAKVTESKGETVQTEVVNDPLIIDLGRRRKREIDRLRDGRGELLDEVLDCITELSGSGQILESSQPVISVVTEKRAKLVASWSPPQLPWARRR